jgi:16S rRNA C967 or C1407 C5-methylase (RsmB/RsmF family)
VVADLCAAPGGKSVELSRNASQVFASDVSASRLKRVLENAQRLEIDTLSAYVADARFPAIRPVDFVLIDAPCTGTGTFRRHPDARWRMRISDIAVMASLQRAILRAAASVVRPGGFLVYATCTLEPEENDAQIDAFLAERSDWRLEAPPEGVVPPSVLDNGRLRVCRIAMAQTAHSRRDCGDRRHECTHRDPWLTALRDRDHQWFSPRLPDRRVFRFSLGRHSPRCTDPECHRPVVR